MMHVLEYFTYHLRPYKKGANLHFTGKLVNSTDWDFTKVKQKPPINNDGHQGMDNSFNKV
jgi:hypothetical protein